MSDLHNKNCFKILESIFVDNFEKSRLCKKRCETIPDFAYIVFMNTLKEVPPFIVKNAIMYSYNS